MRFLLAMAAWVAAIGVTTVVVRDRPMGPVLVVVEAVHGIHAGDVAVGIASAAIAATITLWAFSRWSAGAGDDRLTASRGARGPGGAIQTPEQATE